MPSRNIFRNADPAEGNGNPNPPAAPAAPVQTAAKTVLEGNKSEREIQLEGDLQKALDEKKSVETKNAELENSLNEIITPGRKRFFNRG